eukprot:TRINITY_DN63615_c0_g1_i2.p1 TRINITY_DN63615_c0_g1~~TRINITY_DN63615_c0_g1_i2.p1  ORF type:complete len:446 (+),score=88.08 TRINITY_DN63615_c0_g1_i2:14-1351(+)
MAESSYWMSRPLSASGGRRVQPSSAVGRSRPSSAVGRRMPYCDAVEAYARKREADAFYRRASLLAGLQASCGSGAWTPNYSNSAAKLGRPTSREQVLARWGSSRGESRPTSASAMSRPTTAATPGSGEAGCPASWPPAEERLRKLVDQLASPAVRVPPPAEVQEVPARLSEEEVEALFVEHVPGVKDFLFRGQDGVYSLNFVKSAYAEGLRAFQGTSLHSHLMWLLRLIVNHASDRGAEAAKYLQDVAEAFMDCQAVQARVIERAGFLILGVGSDFRGLLVQLVSEYKTMALRMLAYEECVKVGGPNEDKDPAHAENRLLQDVKRASLDQHAGRFTVMQGEVKDNAVQRFRELFDTQALLHALVAELNSFSADSPELSLPRLFVKWVSERMTSMHVIFDEETYTQIAIDNVFALAVVEAVFLGKPGADLHEEFRGERICSLFTAA